MRLVRYYFGRLNLIAHYDDKYKFLTKTFKTPIVFEKRGFLWGFFDISELKTEFGNFFHGYLVKYESLGEEEIAYPETHELNETQLTNRVIAKSPFFLHLKSGLIAFCPCLNAISVESFRSIFAKLVMKANDYFFIDAEVQSIQEQFKIFEELKKFSKFRKIIIILHPSNPSNRERWRNIDERLKTIEASRLKEEIDFKENHSGLDVLNDNETMNKLYMAEDGYGSAKVIGESEGAPKTVSSKDNPISKKVSEVEDEPHGTFEQLIETIRNIFNRFTL